jgi:hypothetical protein
MLPIVVFTYAYNNTSAGERACHLLVHRLNGLGVEAYSSQGKNCSDWIEPVWPGRSNPFIAVYPEVVYDNPLGAQYVVRWLLNHQGRLGGPKTYMDSDAIFAYSEAIASDAPRVNGILCLVPLERELFFDPLYPNRSGVYFYVGKGVRPQELPSGVVEITRTWPGTRAEVAAVLQRAELLITYDDFTQLIAEATFCGCPVIIEPGHKSYEQHKFLSEYDSWLQNEGKQLHEFIQFVERFV